MSDVLPEKVEVVVSRRRITYANKIHQLNQLFARDIRYMRRFAQGSASCEISRTLPPMQFEKVLRLVSKT